MPGCPGSPRSAGGSAASGSSVRSTPTLGADAIRTDSLASPPLGYEMLGELGRGGMGVVCKACHLSLDRMVALETILADGHARPEDRARFHAEAVAALQHPQVVSLLDFGEHQGPPLFTLEFVPGGSLA